MKKHNLVSKENDSTKTYSKFGLIADTTRLVEQMDEEQTESLKNVLFDEVGVNNQQEFICWVLRNTKHVLTESQAQKIHTKANSIPLQHPHNNIHADDKLSTTPDNVVEIIGSFLTPKESIMFGRSNKYVYLKTQKYAYLKRLNSSGHMSLTLNTLNRLGWNFSNPHLYGAPISLNVWLKPILSKHLWRIVHSKWYSNLFGRATQIGIYGVYALKMISVFDLFGGKNNEIDYIRFGGDYNSKNAANYLQWFENKVADYMKHIPNGRQIKWIKLSPGGPRLKWTNLLLALSKCNFTHLLLDNTEVTIPAIFQPHLTSLCVSDKTKFTITSDLRSVICNLIQVTITLGRTNEYVCKKIQNFLMVLDDYNLLTPTSTCKLLVSEGQFDEIGLDEAEGVITMSETTKEMIERLFYSSKFQIIVVDICDSECLHVMHLFFKFLGRSQQQHISTSIKQVKFDVSLKAMPLAPRDFEMHVIDGSCHVDSNVVEYEVDWNAREEIFDSYFCQIMDWLNRRWNTYAISTGQIIFNVQ